MGTGFKEMVPTVEAAAEPSEPNIHCKVRGQSLVILPGCGLEEKLMGEIVLSLVVSHIGVMRFLQTEWHRHERDRNTWEIERAEMKARVAKLEGENRAAKRLQQGFLTRIKMLEFALKKERAAKGHDGVEKDGLGNEQKPAVENLVHPRCMVLRKYFTLEGNCL